MEKREKVLLENENKVDGGGESVGDKRGLIMRRGWTKEIKLLIPCQGTKTEKGKE